jgi:hypothetical protein
MRETGGEFVVLVSTLMALGASGCGGRQAGLEAMGGASTAQAAMSSAEPQASPCRQPLPSAVLEVPAGNELDMQLDAVGVQIYTCTSTASGNAWVFRAPEAALYERDGQLAGKHYAGPTWESLDGSTVVGARVAGSSPDASAIPWLLLRAVSHSGAGKMEEITFIQRVATRGGLAPADGCGASNVGDVARVPYSATYCFYEAH